MTSKITKNASFSTANDLETKTKNGKPTAEQIAFITAMLNSGALAGVVRSVDDALAVLGGSKDYIQ